MEAVARVGALMAAQRGEFPLHRLEQAGELIRSDAVLSEVTDDEARRIRAEQSTVVDLEPERALETLPRLLADRRDREHLIDLMERAAAMVELNADQVAMLDRIRRVLAPGGVATRLPLPSLPSSAAGTAASTSASAHPIEGQPWKTSRM